MSRHAASLLTVLVAWCFMTAAKIHADEVSLRKAVTFYASFDEKVQGDQGDGSLKLSTRSGVPGKGPYTFTDGFDSKVFRIATGNGPATTTALMALAADHGVAVRSLGVQSTTLDDVFVHYTGRDLRDALQDPAPRDFSFMTRR